jgi:hypothetical protein
MERRRKMRSFCYRLCNEKSHGDNMKFPYIQIISAFIRGSVLMILINFSLKLTGVVEWNYYIVLWPYYVFIGMSLIFSCGSLLLLFNWVCQKINDASENSEA